MVLMRPVSRQFSSFPSPSVLSVVSPPFKVLLMWKPLGMMPAFDPFHNDAVPCGSLLMRYLFALLAFFAANAFVFAGDGNRLSYLDSNEVWYPHMTSRSSSRRSGSVKRGSSAW